MDSASKIVMELNTQGICAVEKEWLKNHTSFKIGGPAAVYSEPNGIEEAQKTLQIARANKAPVFLLGKGTNVLFQDSGFQGVILHIGKNFAQVEVSPGGRIRAGAGADLAKVCCVAKENGLSGLEFAYGIPGSVGGAVFMNAGAYGGETRLVLESVTYLDKDMNLASAKVEDLELGYRTSVFQKNEGCILDATFLLECKDPEEINRVMEEHMAARRSKQPLELPSAGSAFKRPVGAFAGALIDQSGLRGYRVGDAAISEKHCGFIVNVGKATCEDVLALADDVVAKVQQKTGYLLEKEIQVVGNGCQSR